MKNPKELIYSGPKMGFSSFLMDLKNELFLCLKVILKLCLQTLICKFLLIPDGV